MSEQLYARVFVQILDSSLASDWQVRHVFEDFLKLANGGIVDMTREAIARRTNIPMEVLQKAITALESPDPSSRDAEEEGRRLVRLDDHRDWGWLIVNWEKYESIRCKYDEREKTAERVRRHRERKRVSQTLPKTPEADSDSDSERALQNRYIPLQGVTPPLHANENGSEVIPGELLRNCLVKADQPPLHATSNASSIPSLPSEAVFWNDHCGDLPKVQAFSKSRKQHLNARRKDPFWVANYKKAIGLILQSDFCMGKNDRNWRASFDWLIERPDSVVKVVEGKYGFKNEPPHPKTLAEKMSEQLLQQAERVYAIHSK